MTPPSQPPAISPDIRRAVETRLGEVERRYGVSILYAAESGSRAWGFPSPDSDYDVRFLYRHPAEWYLSLIEDRDVIEEGVDENAMDVSGWDIRKALRLMLRSNPALYEWLTSPIVYHSKGGAAAEMRSLCEQFYDRKTLILHYRSAVANKRRLYWRRGEPIKLKKYFYVIRPLAAIAWLSRHKSGLPPMNLDELLAGITLSDSVRSAISDLLRHKESTSELGTSAPIPVLEDWIEVSVANIDAPDQRTPEPSSFRQAADRLYASIVGLSTSAAPHPDRFGSVTS